MNLTTAFLLGVGITAAFGYFACRAAYENGVIDGAKNQWLSSVKAILDRDKGGKR